MPKRHICCERKVRHKSKEGAYIALKRLQKKYGIKASVYHCRRCNGWHIGKNCKNDPMAFWEHIEMKMNEGENNKVMNKDIKKKEIIIVCPKCKKEIKIDDNILKNYYNWKCDECFSFIQLKGAGVSIWHCNTGTPRRKGK